MTIVAKYLEVKVFRQRNMRNIFLEKSCTKRGGETICRPFSKNQISVYHCEEYRNFAWFPGVEILRKGIVSLRKISTPGNQVKLRYFFLVYLWINSLTFYTFCFYCMSKLRAIEIYRNYSWRLLAFIPYKTLLKNHSLIAFTSWDAGQYVNCNCFLGLDVINLENNLRFLIKPFSNVT